VRRLGIPFFAPLAILAGLALAAAAPALAVPACPSQPEVQVLYQADSGMLESVAVDRRGRVFFTNNSTGDLLTLPKGGGPAQVIASGIDAPGGIVFKRNGKLLVGFGDSIEQAADGTASPEAGLLRVDPRTKKSTTAVTGLQMANGVARAPGGAIFASNDLGTSIDRIVHGQVQLGWSTLVSPNGLIVDSTGKYLFANQTFTAAAIQRIPIDDPAHPETYFSAAPADAAAGFDGLARGSGDDLYVAANGAGQVWRIDGPNSACSLLSRDPFPSGPSAVAFGRGHGGIPKSSLLVTTFGGELIELRNAR
jgi:gluconolactonase